MGKTIMLSALIQTHSSPDSDCENPAPQAKHRQLKLNNAFRTMPRKKARVSKGPSATLIVAPTSLLSQWSDELQRSSKSGTVKTVVWHGQNRLDLETAIEDSDEDDKTIKVFLRNTT